MKRSVLVVAAFAFVSEAFGGGDIEAPVEPVVNTPVIADEMPGMQGDYTLSLKAGTLGVGLDVARMIRPDLGIRFNVNALNYNRTETIDNIDYDGTLKLFNFGALLDYYPMQNGFRISGGAYYNGNKFEGSAAPSNTIGITIGDTTYYANEVGRLDTTVSFQSIAPYVGIGWGGNAQEKGWGFYLDLGVMYQGSPKIDAEATINPAVPQGTQDAIRADVEKERLQIEEDASSYKWYPVAMIGVTYTF